MAKVYPTNEDYPITKKEAKTAAVREVLKWATLNLENKNEDFYENFVTADIDVERGEGVDLILNDKEREWIREEFEYIAKVLYRRLEKHRA